MDSRNKLRYSPSGPWLQAAFLILCAALALVLTSCDLVAPTQQPDATASPVAPGEDDGGDAEGGLIEFLTDRDNYPWVPLGLLALVGLILLLILILQDRRMRARALKASKSTGPLPTGIAVKRPSLVVRRPGARSGGLVHELSSEGVTIGRAPDNDLVIESSVEGAKTVSDHHARVYYDMGHWIVKDLDAEHGVYVNGKRTGHNLLQDGWQVKLGDVTMTFYKGSEEGDQ